MFYELLIVLLKFNFEFLVEMLYIIVQKVNIDKMSFTVFWNCITAVRNQCFTKEKNNNRDTLEVL